MTMAPDVSPPIARAFPALAHLDGTARHQSVARRDDAWLHALLRAVGKRTGLAALINTSFNTRGKPICNTLKEALTMLDEEPDLTTSRLLRSAVTGGGRATQTTGGILRARARPRHWCMSHTAGRHAGFGRRLSTSRPRADRRRTPHWGGRDAVHGRRRRRRGRRSASPSRGPCRAHRRCNFTIISRNAPLRLATLAAASASPRPVGSGAVDRQKVRDVGPEAVEGRGAAAASAPARAAGWWGARSVEESPPGLRSASTRTTSTVARTGARARRRTRRSCAPAAGTVRKNELRRTPRCDHVVASLRRERQS